MREKRTLFCLLALENGYECYKLHFYQSRLLYTPTYAMLLYCMLKLRMIKLNVGKGHQVHI